MYLLIETFEGIQKFLDMGGPVLLVIAALLLVMWTLLFERLWFFKTALKTELQCAVSRWEARPEHQSVHAHQIREAIISRVALDINEGLSMIKALVALAPLLGLLGTVTGMIGVFDVLAVTGGGDAKSMAAGVSQATIPTMAGMVAALSGLFGSTYINRIARREQQLLADRLTLN
jgi:biopolymer transport protein ExbB